MGKHKYFILDLADSPLSVLLYASHCFGNQSA